MIDLNKLEDLLSYLDLLIELQYMNEVKYFQRLEIFSISKFLGYYFFLFFSKKKTKTKKILKFEKKYFLTLFFKSFWLLSEFNTFVSKSKSPESVDPIKPIARIDAS